MCGINGIVSFGAVAPPVDVGELTRTREAMHSRGPDAAGIWLSPDGRAGFGHRRLSIIDVSERANQPMVSREGDLVLTFNGEIYNFRELREELERDGERFATTSDTEVVLRMYRRWGDAMLPRLRGMFAFAIWDARINTLFLARDPYGIKPLYYTNDGKSFRFASQVKAILAGGGVSITRDPAGIVGFLLRGHVPEPFTMYEAIRQLPAGTSMIVTRDGASEPRPYFSIASVLRDAVNERRHYSDDERAAIIAGAVRESVRYHLVSDVPVGAFLSSGRDSSTIVALASETAGSLQTVTLRFGEYIGTEKDEAPLAAQVAMQYGTTHSTGTVSGDEFRAELPRALAAMDQPSFDGLNSYFVCKAAAELGWKVALSGTGGDELFGGYTTFRIIPRVVRLFGAFKHAPGAAAAFRRVYGRIARNRTRFSPKTPYTLKYCTSYEGAYLMKRGLFLPDEVASIIGDEMACEGLKRLNLLDAIRNTITPDPGTGFARIAAMESALLLRNQLLRDIDWASMAHSLEVRVPLVDAFLLRKVAPAVFSTRKRDGKELLSRSPYRALPEAILTRKKTGFTIPNVAWLDDRRHAQQHFGTRPWALHILEAAGHATIA
ncbi:MAG: asparagine synthase (glutamine-hydrolyzing) [Acidobacteria bacterium]|nr:asparagine synthase (glutamine-hydrolyzing) [Acidobacteriota bacterium]MBV9185812.1 asparagine synthase (glutamine-hydrolyzing) [Acidobacteriota bacterium]